MGFVGVVVTLPAVTGLNNLTAYSGTTQFILLIAGGGLALLVGTVWVLAASWRLVVFTQTIVRLPTLTDAHKAKFTIQEGQNRSKLYDWCNYI